MIRARGLVLAGLVALLAASACKRKNEPNKILDGIPVNSTVTVVPAQAAQQFVRLENAMLDTVVAVMNRFALPIPDFGGTLTGPTGASQYGFTRSDGRFGTANFLIQFRDAADAVIDPIATSASSNTIASVVITGNGGSTQFNYTFSQRMTLATAGTTTSNKTLTGTADFTSTTTPDTLTFTMASGGIEVTVDGLSRGIVTAAGTGPGGAATSMSLQFYSSHESDGTIAWENQSGTIHLEDNGEGYIVTSTARLLVQ